MGVVVGHVLSVQPHPDADKLRICQVTNGRETVQVVCGAPNVREGLKVPFAEVGAVLPGDFRIKKAKLRGQESFGMLCSESELGISDANDGLMELQEDAPVGEDLRNWLNLDDAVIDIDLTPNRSDCLCVLGIAREVAALNNIPFDEPHQESVPARHNDVFEVRLEAPEACPRYAGRIVRNVDVTRPTPQWMIEKLRRSGIRSIDPVVDITNFVMLELGQPMHAFDLAELNGRIRVRWAQPEEKLVLLDGQEITLQPDVLVIADEQRPLAMAGIMGGEHSGIGASTRDVLLESAFFAPEHIAGKARRFGLHTDSSHRFERGVDPEHQKRAIERATQLLLDICGGEPGPTFAAEDPDYLPKRELVRLKHADVARRLGISLTKTQVEEKLARLKIVAEKVHEDGWSFRPPSHRFDIRLDVDLIEELARLYGYDNFPESTPNAHLRIKPVDERRTPLQVLKQHLQTLGFSEAITYSFVDGKIQAAMLPEFESVELANPIASDMSVMRTSLVPGLAKTAAYNQARQQSRVRLFESGLRFVGQGEHLSQEPMLAGILTGRRSPESWFGGKDEIDFYDVKGVVESLLGRAGVMSENIAWSRSELKMLHPGQGADVLVNAKKVGHFGILHPELNKMLNLNGRTGIFELCLNEIMCGEVPAYQGISRFPEVRRDIAIVVGKQVAWSRILEVIRAHAGDWCISQILFDVYEGENVEPDHKSCAVGLTWRHPERTLTDDEVNQYVNSILNALKSEFNATLRS
ncbi:MAG: phenylalanine--tRNA ligase subunit beta [Gammaproteobacteria bacterium]|nr:MAG: phenylalanine--tRNA ligase subunit beta [Gammaproteobacteria bacterium]